MKVINFAEQQTVVNRYMSELRDVCIQKDRARFRRNLERIGEVMAYEISKTLDYSVKDIQTPLGTAPTLLYNDPIVLGTIFRAGLPFHQGFLNVFEEADNAFVSAYRFYKDKECHEVGIHIECLATPDLKRQNAYHRRSHAGHGRKAWNWGSRHSRPKAYREKCIYVVR